MKINELEIAVLLQHLENIGFSIDHAAKTLAKLEVKDRTYSGVGFITEFKQQDELRIGRNNESYTGGEVGAKLNFSIDTGYLFYVKNDHLISIEGYTFGDSWPEKLESVETYKSDLG